MRIVPLALALIFAARVAEAALTTPKCLVLKRQAWGALRKCELGEELKRLKGKATDFAKCQTKFDEKIAKIDGKAVAAQIACRFGNNGDGTITDYETGLQWEKKNGGFPLLCLIDDPHCVTEQFTWLQAARFVDAGGDDSSVTCFFGHCDWRLPTAVELRSILIDPCSTAPCIDPTFGGTSSDRYWSGSNNDSTFRWVDFSNATSGGSASSESNHVRAVRQGL
jgi:hypothetical protein